jgi:5,5'-dehydrodivanillate O-demethylase
MVAKPAETRGQAPAEAPSIVNEPALARPSSDLGRAKRDDLDLVATGPGTLAGRYLRLFWQPVYLSRDLAKGRVTPIRVMGVDYTLYRDEFGVAHVVAARCPHRGTLLSTGLVKGRDIACHYHGWTFAPSGACVAQPAEPAPFCPKVKIETYPTREMAGFVLAYFGPHPAPALPGWPEVGDFAHRHRIDCNYFQSAENIMDDVHLPFVHANSPLRYSTRMTIPRVVANETQYGLRLELHHASSVEMSHFIMPNMCYVIDRHRNGITFQLLMAYVPIDDTHHNHFVSLRTTPRLIGKMGTLFDLVLGGRFGLGRFRRDLDGWCSELVNDVLGGRRSFGNLISSRIQDAVMIVGQGAIADRSAEHLGRTDAAVILLRKLWRRELKRLAEEKPPTPYCRPSAFSSRPGEEAVGRSQTEQPLP